jgi:F-type H+-transporting ATPase subunit epsilon
MNLTIELVTPEKLVFSSDAHMVTVPGIDGDFGVMHGHAPLISALRPGIVDVYETDSKIQKSIFIADGFAEINQETCTILAGRAVDVTGDQEEALRLMAESPSL